MSAKYEFVPGDTITIAPGRILKRIRALATTAVAGVAPGNLGGYVESETNLAQVSGNAWVSGNADYAVVAGFGSYFRTTTFFRCKDKILRVQCGCFYGDLAQFREIVKKTHGDSKYAKEYLAIADLMELHFSDKCGGEQMNDGKIY